MSAAFSQAVRAAAVNDAQAVAEVPVQTWPHLNSETLPAEFLSGLSVTKRKAMWAASIAKNLSPVLVAGVGGNFLSSPCH